MASLSTLYAAQMVFLQSYPATMSTLYEGVQMPIRTHTTYSVSSPGYPMVFAAAVRQVPFFTPYDPSWLTLYSTQ